MVTKEWRENLTKENRKLIKYKLKVHENVIHEYVNT